MRSAPSSPSRRPRTPPDSPVPARPGRGSEGPDGSAEIIIIDCSGSMEYPHTKIAEARAATAAAVDVVRDGVLFSVIAGTNLAWPVFPVDGSMARADASSRAAAKQAVSGPAGRRRHGHRPVAGAGPADVRAVPGQAPARHLAHRRQEPAREPRTARRGHPPVRGRLQLRLPWRRHRLGGQGTAHDIDRAARQRGHRARPVRAGRRLRGHDAERDGQAGRRRGAAGLDPAACHRQVRQAGGAHGRRPDRQARRRPGRRPATTRPGPGGRGRAATTTSASRSLRPESGRRCSRPG